MPVLQAVWSDSHVKKRLLQRLSLIKQQTLLKVGPNARLDKVLLERRLVEVANRLHVSTGLEAELGSWDVVQSSTRCATRTPAVGTDRWRASLVEHC